MDPGDRLPGLLSCHPVLEYSFRVIVSNRLNALGTQRTLIGSGKCPAVLVMVTVMMLQFLLVMVTLVMVVMVEKG